MRRAVMAIAVLAIALSALTASSALAATPTISGFAPASGPAAWLVTLTGTGFTGATAVTFTPTDPAYLPQPALFTAESDTTIVGLRPVKWCTSLTAGPSSSA